MTQVTAYAGRRSGRQKWIRAAFYPSKANLGRRVAVGASWQFALVAIRIILTIGSTAVLARLLTPEDYGLNGMASIVVEVAALLTNLGFGAILIQKQKLTRLDLDSAFWISMGIGVGLMFMVMLAAYPAALFFKQPELVAVLLVASLNFLVMEANVVPSAVLNRLLMFKVEVLIQLLQLVIRISIAILIAWMGGGYWSLVIAPLVAGVIGTIVNLWWVGYIPRLRFSRKFVHNNWHASGSYLGNGLISHLLSNFDYMVVGKRFGAEPLGYYQTAFSLPEELRNRFSGPLQRVLMPAYSLMQNDSDAFRKAFLNNIKLFSAVMFPLGAGMAATADHIVPVLYGDKWLPVIPLLQILAIGGAIRAVSSLTASVFSASGVPQLAFKIQLYVAPVIIALVLIGSSWGVVGVAWGMLLAQFTGFVSVPFAMRRLSGRSIEFYKAIISSVVASICMVAFLNLNWILEIASRKNHVVALGLMALLGVVSYVTIWILMELRVTFSFIKRIKKQNSWES